MLNTLSIEKYECSLSQKKSTKMSPKRIIRTFPTKTTILVGNVLMVRLGETEVDFLMTLQEFR